MEIIILMELKTFGGSVKLDYKNLEVLINTHFIYTSKNVNLDMIVEVKIYT